MNNKILKLNKNPLFELYLYSVSALVFAGVMLGMTNTFCEKGGAMCVQGTGMIILTVGILFALVLLELIFRGPFSAIKVYKNINTSNRRASIGGIALYIFSIVTTIIMIVPIILRFV